MSDEFQLEEVSLENIDEAVEVLCDAFHGYPTMQFIVGEAGEDYARQLKLLVGFFARARFLRGDHVLAAKQGDQMVGVANIVCPDSEAPAELERYRESLWQELGDEARQRYELFGEATEPLIVDEPHYHLAMIGVRQSHVKQGVARRLLEIVHEMSASNPDSKGVSLTTERPDNVDLYRQFGYQVVGRAELGEGEELESWGMFRRDPDVE